MQAPQPVPQPARAGGPAPLARRFGALFIDWIACVLVTGGFVHPTRQSWAPVAALILGYGFFIGVFGASPGMYLLRLRCVRVTDGAPVGIFWALVRGVLLCLVIPALIMDDQRRGLHDRAAGSIVVNAAPKG